ncbi:MAG: DUF5687 family protein [Saprospiraceae bacterium]|nr:DUF5687 family protein [Saprospiraceae bacterium]
MIARLLKHYKKETFRSSVFTKNLTISIIVGFFMFLGALYLLMIGLLIDKILTEAFPDNDPIIIFNGILLYYFAIDLVLRFLLQGVPVVSIQPYLHLPVKKQKIIHYFLIRSIIRYVNILPLFVMIPFAFKVIAPYESINAALIWLGGFVLIMLTNSYLTLYFKKQLVAKPIIPAIVAAIITIFMILDKYAIISLSSISSNLFEYLIQDGIYIFLPLLLFLIVYFFNYNYFIRHSYPEEISIKKKKDAITTKRLDFLEKYGETGQVLMLELKLILRHKRTKSLLYMSVLFLFYGLFFYTQEKVSEMMPAMLIFCGIFITGFFTISYGNFLFGWNSNFFDGLLSTNINTTNYLKAKLWIFLSVSIVAFVLSIPYAYFGFDIVLINFCALLYNLGVSSFVIIYFATIKPKRIDLNQSHAFNFNGVTGSQYVAMLPVMVAPMIIYAPFGIFISQEAGFIAVGVVGIIGLLFYKTWLRLLAKRFSKMKYSIAEGFRQD